MFEANLKIISELKDFINYVLNEPDALSKFSLIDNAFTRSRKLPFDRLVLLITKLCKKSLSVEIDSFFADLNESNSCTVSAFCQQRQKLDYRFFSIWNQLLVLCFLRYKNEHIKRWKNYRLVAVDGSNISLVNTTELNTYFGGQSNQHSSFVQAKTLYCYDILNELVLGCDIQPYRHGEIKMAISNIDNLESDMIVIYDRNFSNFRMAALHCWQEKEIKFIIRAREDINFISDFIKNGYQSTVVNFPVTHTAISSLKESGFIVTKKTILKVRLVRVELKNSIEVLITNLWECDGHTDDELKELYAKRWAIESNISVQKNILQLESFSGLSVLSVKQDFFATVFISNLHSIIIQDAQKTVDIKFAHRKHHSKINQNKSAGKLRIRYVQLFTTKEPMEIIIELHNYFIRDPLPVRKGRSFPRIIKNKQSNSKHKTFMNYKPTY